MTEEEGKKEGEWFEFTPKSEAMGCISLALAQARVLAMSAARATPEDYGRRYQGVPMALMMAE